MRLALCLLLASALGTRALAERVRFRSYGQAERLFNPTIRGIHEDKVGFLWVTTAHGVYKFDGERFEYQDGTRGLPDLDIRWVHGAADGSVWLRSRNRLWRWDRRRFTAVFEGFTDGSYNDAVYQSIDSDASGTLWMISGDRLMSLPKTASNGKATPEVAVTAPAALNSLLRLKDGRLRLGCGDGLCEFSGGRLERWGPAEGVPADRYMMLAEGPDGIFYARSRSRILRRRPGETRFQEITGGLHSLGSDQPAPMLILDFQRRLLTNTEDGLARLDNHGWTVLNETNGMPSDLIRAGYVDRYGGVWLGTTAGGVIRWLGDGHWRILAREEGIPRRGLDQVVQDPDGGVWLGSAPGGVFRGDSQQGHWQFHRMTNLPPAAALHIDPSRNLWIGGSYGGIFRYEPGTRQLARLDDARSPITALAFLTGVDGRLWIASYKGLFRLSAAGTLGQVLPRPGEPPLEVYALTEGAQGSIWAGSSRGLFRILGDQIDNFTEKDGLPRDSVRALATDGKHVWMGTWQLDGIRAFEVDGRKLKPVPDRSLGERLSTFFLRFDPDGRLWAGTFAGIRTFDGKLWRRYSSLDVLPGDQCMSMSSFSGGLWFATNGGLAQYTNPTDHPSPAPPELIITSLAFRAEEMDAAAQPITVEYSQADLRVDFGVLSSVADVPFAARYRLVGMFSDWRETAAHYLEFFSLPAGRYTLELAARGIEGTWNPTPTRLPFRVLPPWYESWWARGAAIAAAAGVLVLLWRLRMERATRRASQRVQQMVDYYPATVFLLNPDGRFQLINRAMEEFSGIPRNKFVGRTCHELVRPEVAVPFSAGCDQAFQTRALHTWDQTMVTARGTRNFRLTAFPLFGESGEISSLCGFVQDMTSERQLQQDLRALSARQSQVLEDERARISREIHDELGQMLTVLKMELAAIQRGAGGTIATLVPRVDEVIQSVRRLASQLRPVVLDHFGLAAAVEWQVTEFGRRGDIRCTSEIDQDLNVPRDLGTTVFRILQESLTNIGRHAKATKIDVALNQEDGELCLLVADNGRGIQDEELTRHGSLGLLGMRERAAAAGGTVEIRRRADGGGTVVEARFPMSK